MEKDWMRTNEWVKRKRKMSQDQDQHVSESLLSFEGWSEKFQQNSIHEKKKIKNFKFFLEINIKDQEIWISKTK